MSGYPSWAYVGAKVVAVGDPDTPILTWPKHRVQKNEVCTITRLMDGPNSGKPCVVVLEYPDHLYLLQGFRPVHTLDTDMVVFRKIASNLPTTADLEKLVDVALERLG